MRIPSRPASATLRMSTRRPSTSTVPRVGPNQPAEDVDQRRLPRAVLAQEGVDLPASEREIDPLEGMDAPEPLGHAPQREEGPVADAVVGHGLTGLLRNSSAFSLVISLTGILMSLGTGLPAR